MINPRAFVPWMIALLLGAGIANAQSLAELAKKEKERRQTNQEEAKTVITDRELATSYGGVSGAPQASSASADAEGEGTGEEGDEPSDEATDETRTPEYWRGRVAAANQKIQEAEQRLSDDNWGEGQRVGIDPFGVNNLSRREQEQQKLDAAQAELTAIRAEARRAGVPPGWVR